MMVFRACLCSALALLTLLTLLTTGDADTSDVEVQQWLKDLKLEHLASKFVAHDIEFDLLPYLTKSDLTSMGISSVGNQKKMLLSIEKFAKFDDEDRQTYQKNRRRMTASDTSKYTGVKVLSDKSIMQLGKNGPISIRRVDVNKGLFVGDLSFAHGNDLVVNGTSFTSFIHRVMPVVCKKGEVAGLPVGFQSTGKYNESTLQCETEFDPLYWGKKCRDQGSGYYFDKTMIGTTPLSPPACCKLQVGYKKIDGKPCASANYVLDPLHWENECDKKAAANPKKGYIYDKSKLSDANTRGCVSTSFDTSLCGDAAKGATEKIFASCGAAYLAGCKNSGMWILQTGSKKWSTYCLLDGKGVFAGHGFTMVVLQSKRSAIAPSAVSGIPNERSTYNFGSCSPGSARSCTLSVDNTEKWSFGKSSAEFYKALCGQETCSRVVEQVGCSKPLSQMSEASIDCKAIAMKDGLSYKDIYVLAVNANAYGDRTVRPDCFWCKDGVQCNEKIARKYCSGYSGSNGHVSVAGWQMDISGHGNCWMQRGNCCHGLGTGRCQSGNANGQAWGAVWVR